MLAGYMSINGELLHIKEYGDFLWNTVNKEETYKYGEQII